MMTTPRSTTRGFTLVELTIAMALGVLVIGTAVGLFSKALDASFIVTQRAEMQQNARSGMGMIQQDISLAGSGLPVGGVQLPTGAGSTNSLFGCDQNTCYIANNNWPGGNHMSGVIPGPFSGTALTNGGTNSDAVTILYTDTTYALNEYAVTLAADGTSATFALPNPLPAPLPSPWPPTPVNDPVVGLKVGDLVLFTNNLGSAVGEVTNVAGGGLPTVVSFSNGDALNLNQSGAASGRIADISGATNTVAYRLMVITYYLDLPAGADNKQYTADDGQPRLMRQVSGHPPTPVAEEISGLQFTYDIYDDATGQATANLKDAGMGVGKSPNQIRKINMSLSARAPLQGHGGYQNFDVATSISARNMSFKDRYQ